MKRLRNQSKEDYNKLLASKAEPILEKLINTIIKEDLIEPSAIYGYFPCGSEKNDLIVFSPVDSKYLGKFSFPRQKSGNRFCIADFFTEIKNNKSTDILPMQAVTMGKKASEYSKQLFDQNMYTDYLYFHGLSVQLAEACAELVHALIREECGFNEKIPLTNKQILAQRYRGCRYSFGYPACPNTSDSRLQLEWLDTKRIGLTIDESDQLHPEQSTTAIISLHTQAKYFST